MKNKEKFIMYIWICSLVAIVFIGILLCLQRPAGEIIQTNKELLSTADKIRSFYRNRPDYWGLNTQEVIANKLYVGQIENDKLINALGKEVVVGSDVEGTNIMPGQRSFVISHLKATNKECIELAAFRWQEEGKLGLISFSIQNDSGDYEFSWGNKGLPLSRSRAKQYCKEENNLLWTFE